MNKNCFSIFLSHYYFLSIKSITILGTISHVISFDISRVVQKLQFSATAENVVIKYIIFAITILVK